MALVENLIKQLKRDERLRLSAYLDSVGVLTIGYGHNLAASPLPGITKPGDTITQAQAEQLLAEDTDIAIREAVRLFPWVQRLNDPRQAVIYNMMFNLGASRLRGFRRFLSAAERGKYQTAALEMIDSQWARQVKGRAERLAKQMSTGEWV